MNHSFVLEKPSKIELEKDTCELEAQLPLIFSRELSP